MNSLPPELQQYILDFCSFDDCKNVRQSSKALCAVAIQRLFKSISVGFFTDTLDDIANIAGNPTIMPCIRSLTVVKDHLPILSRNVWRTCVKTSQVTKNARNQTFRAWLTREQGKRVLNGHLTLPRKFDDPETDPYWKTWQSLLRYQDEWSEQHDSKFTKILSLLKNLTTIRVLKLGPVGNNNNPVWRRVHRATLVGPDEWQQATYQKYHCGAFEHRNLKTLLRAIDERSALAGNSSIQQLEIIDDYDLTQYLNSIYTRPASWDGLGSRLTTCLAPSLTFDGLRKLKICDYTAMWEAAITYDFSLLGAGLCRALSQMTVLETLRFEAMPPEEADDDDVIPRAQTRSLSSYPDLLHELRNVHLPRLITLRLTTSMSEKSLLNFISRHGSTLKRIEIVDSILRNSHDRWQSTLGALYQIVRLESFYFEGLVDASISLLDRDSGMQWLKKGSGHDTDHNMAIEEAVLRGGEMPTLDYDNWPRHIPWILEHDDWPRHNPGILENDGLVEDGESVCKNPLDLFFAIVTKARTVRTWMRTMLQTNIHHD